MVDNLAARLDHALEECGIELDRDGKPERAGTEHGETLRIELHLDGRDTRGLRTLIRILETAKPRTTDTNAIAERTRAVITRQLLSSREGQVFCASLNAHQREALDELIDGPLSGYIALDAISVVAELGRATSKEVH